jgi:hypothetical protein
MTHRTAEEAKIHYIEKMGDDLGTQFAALWQEVVRLHMKWGEYVELFGSKPTRVELLNKAAPNFFHMIQHLLWEETLLHIARLTDKPTSTRGKANLTILSLPAVVACPATKTALNEMAEAAVRKTAFCRDWRNRRIAHHDLSLLMNPTAEPLAKGSIKQVNEALSSIVSVLNEVQMHYEGSESFFSVSSL